MTTTALSPARLCELNEALSTTVSATQDIVEAARRLGATVIAGRGDAWLCQLADGRARLWRATDKDRQGELDEFDGFDDQIGGFGHRHTCLNCQEVLAGEVFDCPADYDHAVELCLDCLQAGVEPKDPESDLLLTQGLGD